MKRRPRRLFKAQRRGEALYVGPQFVGPEPHYLPKLDALVKKLDALVKQTAGAARPGEVTHVEVYHDDDCAVFAGGPCDCDPDVRLVKPPEPHS